MNASTGWNGLNVTRRAAGRIQRVDLAGKAQRGAAE